MHFMVLIASRVRQYWIRCLTSLSLNTLHFIYSEPLFISSVFKYTDFSNLYQFNYYLPCYHWPAFRLSAGLVLNPRINKSVQTLSLCHRSPQINLCRLLEWEFLHVCAQPTVPQHQRQNQYINVSNKKISNKSTRRVQTSTKADDFAKFVKLAPPHSGNTIEIPQSSHRSESWYGSAAELNGSLLERYHIRQKLTTVVRQFPKLSAKFAELSLHQNGKKFVQKVPISGLRSGELPKFNGDFLVQRHISGKIFTKIRSVAFMWSC